MRPSTADSLTESSKGSREDLSSRQSRMRAGDLVAVIGDSITQACKYSALMETYFWVCQPTALVRVMLFGWAGEQASGLNGRIENDIVRYHPSVATTFYGMNDGQFLPFEKEKAEVFRRETCGYVRRLKAGGTRLVVLGSPGCVDTDSFRRTDPTVYNETLARFGRIAQQVAEEESVVFADVHTPMVEAMQRAKVQYGSGYLFAGEDGIHADWGGHMIMAYAFLKALIGEHEVGRVTMDYAVGDAHTSEGHTALSSKVGRVELESTRYPFCFFGGEMDAAGTRSSVIFSGFNREMNRFTLVVKGAPAYCRVTWGTQSRNYRGEDLAKGINLAEDFMDRNPFYEAFMHVLDGVLDKQAYEFPVIKQFVTGVPMLERVLPAEKHTVARLVCGLAAERQRKVEDVERRVVPVRHCLKIEPLSEGC